MEDSEARTGNQSDIVFSKLRKHAFQISSVLILVSHCGLTISSEPLQVLQFPVQGTEMPVTPMKISVDASQLLSPRSPHEFLNLLRKISENFLLLNPDFQRDDLLLKLFGPAKIHDALSPEIKARGLQFKNIDFDDGSAFKNGFKSNGLTLSFIREIHQNSVKSVASLRFLTSESDNPFSSKLIEAEFGPSGESYDPLDGQDARSTNENIDASFRRNPPLHVQGYFRVVYFHESPRFTSKLQVEFNRIGNLRSIDIDQKER